MPPFDASNLPSAPRVWLRDVQAARTNGGSAPFVPADVIASPGSQELLAMQNFWKPLKDQLKAEYAAAGRQVPESVTWNWPEKAHLELPAKTEVYCLKLPDSELGRYEGAIMLTSEPFRRLHDPGCATYISYVEAAPWNIEMYVMNTGIRYTGVGLALLRLAIARSMDMGCEGAIALHSVAEASTLDFYRRRHFEDLGYDEAAGYQYLELPPDRARDLLTGATK